MNAVVGIISFLPDDPEVKTVRVKRLNALFQQCDQLLNLPIMIIAQNGQGVSLREGTIRQSITIHQYPKLGITGARNELRKKFLESDYDYLIMLDDDSQLTGTPEDAQLYLDYLSDNPGKYCEFKPMLLKLFAISKEVYSLIELPEGGADNEDPEKRYFEDMTLIKALDKLYIDKKLYIPHKSFMEVSDAAGDQYNSGGHKNVYVGNYNRHNTGDRSRALVKGVTKDSEGKVKWIWPDYVEPNTHG